MVCSRCRIVDSRTTPAGNLAKNKQGLVLIISEQLWLGLSRSLVQTGDCLLSQQESHTTLVKSCFDQGRTTVSARLHVKSVSVIAMLPQGVLPCEPKKNSSHDLPMLSARALG
jgi:hypothetical protein